MRAEQADEVVCPFTFTNSDKWHLAVVLQDPLVDLCFIGYFVGGRGDIHTEH
ncbi:unannotated protein [freshwater metagenome]|uniref:Unannotated protein n=1 Tax=freshwater metagenome TaxID=449393 RepID=A0A6J6GRY2_9ZZZZ